MPKLIPYHLTFPHGLHVGRGGVESLAESFVSVPSDTLFAALLDTWHYLGNKVDDLLATENAEPAFRVTSAFPRAGGVRFFPMPVDLTPLFEQKTLGDFDWNKPLKRIRFISETLIRKALSGEKLDDWLFPKDEHSEPQKGVALQGGALWLSRDEVKHLPDSIRCAQDEKSGEEKERPLFALRRQTVWKMQNVPRVSLDRISSAPNLFQAERVLFAKDCGLWFGLTGGLESAAIAIAALAENGLGGERSVGYGGFAAEAQEALDFADPVDCAYLLSRYHPAEEEVAMLQDERSAYRMESVAGWLRTSGNTPAQRRKRVWMIAEGSRVAGKPHGDAPDVKPEYKKTPGVSHPVYRPGFAVALNWDFKG
jgi:CRISPR-associated protein Csm4